MLSHEGYTPVGGFDGRQPISYAVAMSRGEQDSRIVGFGEATPRWGRRLFLADTARVIGDVIIGDDCSVWYGTVVRGDVHHIRIGDRVNLQDNTVVHVTTDMHPTIIEDDVTIGHRAVLHGCTVRQGALIGMGAVVMDEAVIGQNAMVGAGALVAPGTHIPDGMLAIGFPARPKRPLTERERAWLCYSAAHYVDISGRYLAAGDGVVGDPRA